jgi:hypothetical protein
MALHASFIYVEILHGSEQRRMLSNCLTTLHQQCLFAAGDPRTCHPSVSKAHTRYTMKSSMITRGRSALCSGPVPAQQGARRRLTVVATSTADPAVRWTGCSHRAAPDNNTISQYIFCLQSQRIEPWLLSQLRHDLPLLCAATAPAHRPRRCPQPGSSTCHPRRSHARQTRRHQSLRR